ncbi:type IV pilus biogenesis/stability protein PilW [Bacteroides sp. 51]|uniref:tetratricopeptide repeat protein n=1 Tax=Bacteroides sp. 51 TaxID=2302938 RepID=UPI0013D2C042|nr:hypothetical protein [Bacteroides sp. 51]
MNKKISIYTGYFIVLCFLLGSLFSCRSSSYHQQTHQTEALFLLPSGGIRISHPNDGSSQAVNGAHVLSEQVEYTTAKPDDTHTSVYVEDTPMRLDTNHVYALSGVTVVSKARFAPVREGHVNVEFAIHVPKQFLSDNYHIRLTPELLHNDSLVLLDDVVLRGKNFIKKQEEDYTRYDQYIASIVDPSGYDTAFIDRRAAEKELERRRKDEINTYYNRFNQYQEYLKWRSELQKKYDEYNVQVTTKLNRELDAHAKAYVSRLKRHKAIGGDTVALRREYESERQKIIDLSPVQRQIVLGVVPEKFHEFYLNGIEQEDIKPVLPGKSDSIRIASKYRLHDQIAMNEIRDSRREEAFKEMVPTPYLPDAHYTATIAPEWNFNYKYTTSYPVTSGLNTLHLTLKGDFVAVDGSRYSTTQIDTLSYVISSMDELAKRSLLDNPRFTDVQRKEYAQALDLMKNREYKRALQLLNSYADYNTALALTCLGYDEKAYDLLKQLRKNADTHYLMAILCCRLKKEQEAIRELKSACKLDESKWFRSDRDPEISRLIKRYGLKLDDE